MRNEIAMSLALLAMTEETIIAPLTPVSLRSKRGNLGGEEDMRSPRGYPLAMAEGIDSLPESE